MRKQQENLLMATHAAGRIEATVLRLPDFYGLGLEARFLHSALRAANHCGAADMVSPIDQPHEFVPDVGPVVVSLVHAAGVYWHIWNFACAGSTNQQALVQEMERQTGCPQ